MALLAVVVAFVVVWLQHSRRVEFLAHPPAPRQSRLKLLGQWASPVRTQWQRVKTGLFGPSRFVTISATVLELDSPAVLTNFSDIADVRTGNSGACVFVVKEAQAWKEKLVSFVGVKALDEQKLTVQDDRQGQLSRAQMVWVGSGTNIHPEWAGWWLDVWPRAHRHSVNLTCFFSQTELIAFTAAPVDGIYRPFMRTNFAFGARVEISEGGGVVLLSGATNRNGKISAAILAPVVQRPPGK